MSTTPDLLTRIRARAAAGLAVRDDDLPDCVPAWEGAAVVIAGPAMVLIALLSHWAAT